MPNGVICGGAVEGSNQLGAIVTCQAMEACPAGVWAATGEVTAATSSERTNGRSQSEIRNGVMTSLQDDWAALAQRMRPAPAGVKGARWPFPVANRRAGAVQGAGGYRSTGRFHHG